MRKEKINFNTEKEFAKIDINQDGTICKEELRKFVYNEIKSWESKKLDILLWLKSNLFLVYMRIESLTFKYLNIMTCYSKNI